MIGACALASRWSLALAHFEEMQRPLASGFGARLSAEAVGASQNGPLKWVGSFWYPLKYQLNSIPTCQPTGATILRNALFYCRRSIYLVVFDMQHQHVEAIWMMDDCTPASFYEAIVLRYRQMIVPL